MRKRQSTSSDVLVIGAGVMGCAIAWELSRRGAKVTVLERSVPGAEASSAAAGILGAQAEAHAPSRGFALALKSRARYAAWAKALFKATGIDIEYRLCGVLRVALNEKAAREVLREPRFQLESGCKVDLLSARQARARVAVLTDAVQGGVAFPDDARVDPPKLLRALRIAGERAGARFQSGTYVQRAVSDAGRVSGVALDDGRLLSAAHVVVAAGSWSSLVRGVPLPASGVVPARGHIVELRLPTPLFAPVVMGPRCYLVPRDDGRVLVGSTLEFVGFRREVTAGAVHTLLDAAIELVPALCEANLGSAWSSFRPYTEDGLPLIGETDIQGLIVATGHYRNGILLAPATADIVTALVLGKRPALDIEAFSPMRAQAERPRSAGTQRRSRL